MNIESTRLGEAIREVRKARGMTQEEVADAIGVGVNYLSLLENGRRGVSTATLNKLGRALRVPPSLIMVLGTNPEARDADPTAGLTKKLQALIRTTLRAEWRPAKLA